VSEFAHVVTQQAREFQGTAYAVMASPDLDTQGRAAAMQWLLNGARAYAYPELACRAVERGLVEWTLGRSREAWYWERAVEEAVEAEVELVEVAS
jgi:hypothetical protein